MNELPQPGKLYVFNVNSEKLASTPVDVYVDKQIVLMLECRMGTMSNIDRSDMLCMAYLMQNGLVGWLTVVYRGRFHNDMEPVSTNSVEAV